MKKYHAFATPKHSQTEETLSCSIIAENIREARKLFQEGFRNVEKVTVSKFKN